MNRFIFLLFSTFFLTPAVALAGEIGVTNSYGTSFRDGTGSTIIDFTSNIQTIENSSFGAEKEESSFFINGEITADIEGGEGGAEGTIDGASFFSGESLSSSWGEGTRTMTEETSVTGNTFEDYSFGSNNFSHSLSVFSR